MQKLINAECRIILINKLGTYTISFKRKEDILDMSLFVSVSCLNYNPVRDLNE